MEATHPIPRDEPQPERCVLAHRIFSMFGDVAFVRSEADGTPVMLVPMGERRAALPLRALQREFAIDDATPDGRMLGLVAEALDYVPRLQPGDELPAEVRSGNASWEVDDAHRRRATARLQLRLLEWLDPASRPAGDAEAGMLERLHNDPALRASVQTAFEAAARALGLADPQEAVRLIGVMADELAYIEALRDGLLSRLCALDQRLAGLGAHWNGDAQRSGTLTQVRRLLRIGLQQIADRFTEVDAHTGEVLSALRNADSQRTFIRSNRDWLHRSRLAWLAVLDGWDATPPGLHETSWRMLNATYRFLAPRFMPVKEWDLTRDRTGVKRPKPLAHAMTW